MTVTLGIRSGRRIHVNPAGAEVEALGTMFFGTHDVEGPAIAHADRTGRCYELSGFALVLGDGVPRGSSLVHGTIDGGPTSPHGRIGHGWLRLPDGLLWEPILAAVYREAEWMEWADARVDRTYTRREAYNAMTFHGTYGRWHDSPYP